MSIDLKEAERIRDIIVQPMVDALKQQINTLSTSIDQKLQPLIDTNKSQDARLTDHDTSIAGLQKNQKRALVGWGVFATAVSMGLTASWEWVKGRVKIG